MASYNIRLGNLGRVRVHCVVYSMTGHSFLSCVVTLRYFCISFVWDPTLLCHCSPRCFSGALHVMFHFVHLPIVIHITKYLCHLLNTSASDKVKRLY